MQKEVKYSFKQWCEDNGHADWLDLWDYELNGVGPGEVSYGSKHPFWFKCPRELHESEKWKPVDLIKKTKWCCRKCRTFGQWIIDNYGPDAIEKYCSERNEMDWFEVFPTSKDIKLWFRCNQDNHPDYQMSPRHFHRGCRCPVCVNRKIVAGVNDVATTNPEFVQYFKFQDNATQHSISSRAEVWFKCPLCGAEKLSSINLAFASGHYVCSACRHNSSYNNRFVHAFLAQVGEKSGFSFKDEKIFEWSKHVGETNSYRAYDFWIGSPHCIIIEAHGNQHYNREFMKGAYRTLSEEKENDVFKHNLAIENGIDPQKYIVLDCRHSSANHIRNSIMMSELPSLLNFTDEDIDWVLCDQQASSNLVRVAADIWLSGVTRIVDIAAIMNCSDSSVRLYLKQARRLGWVNYVTRYEKPVLCKENGLIFANLRCCELLSEGLLQRKITARQISGAISRNTKTHGFSFEYISLEEYQQIKLSEPHRVFGIEYLCRTA